MFKPNSNEVIHKQINVSKKFVTSAVFVPHDKSFDGGLSWERLSQLYFIDEDQSLMTVKSKSEVESGIRRQSQVCHFSCRIASIRHFCARIIIVLIV